MQTHERVDAAEKEDERKEEVAQRLTVVVGGPSRDIRATDALRNRSAGKSETRPCKTRTSSDALHHENPLDTDRRRASRGEHKRGTGDEKTAIKFIPSERVGEACIRPLSFSTSTLGDFGTD